MSMQCSDPRQEQELRDLRNLVIKLQRDVTRQEGQIQDMKKIISLCKTEEQADQQFLLLSTPEHVDKKFDAVKRHLMIEIDGKASKSDLNSALSKKASTADLMNLTRDMESLIDHIKKHTMNGEVLHLMSPVDSVVPNQFTALNSIDTTQLDLMAEQLSALESAFDDFVAGAEPKPTKKSSSKGHSSGPIRQIHELTDHISTFDKICGELDTKYKTLSECANTYPDKLTECIKTTGTSQQAMVSVEQMISSTAMDPEKIYLEVHPKVQEMSKNMSKALEYMEEEVNNNRMLSSRNIDQDLGRLRNDLSQLQTNLQEQIRSISDIIGRLNRDDTAHSKKLAIWQEDIMNTLNLVKNTAESNQTELKNFQQPILDQINIMKSENKMFFKELLRIEGQCEELIYEFKRSSKDQKHGNR